jgi:hypothetical protein
VFGPEADPDLVTDAKHGLAAIVGEAQEAKLSFSRDGSSVLAARFDSPAAAERARDTYGKFFAFAQAAGSDADGWTARRHRGQGEWVHLVTAGPELYAWTNANKEVESNRAIDPGLETARLANRSDDRHCLVESHGCRHLVFQGFGMGGAGGAIAFGDAVLGADVAQRVDGAESA